MAINILFSLIKGYFLKLNNNYDVKPTSKLMVPQKGDSLWKKLE